MRQVRRTIAVVAGAGWVAAWVWLFSFSYSESYFEYNRCSRVPVFVAAILGIMALPVGAVLVWRRFRSIVGVVLGQVCVSLVGILPLAATSFTLSRLPRPCSLSGDDAMGVGIDFLLLSGVGAAFVVGTALAGVARAAAARRSA